MRLYPLMLCLIAAFLFSTSSRSQTLLLNENFSGYNTGNAILAGQGSWIKRGHGNGTVPDITVENTSPLLGSTGNYVEYPHLSSGNGDFTCGVTKSFTSTNASTNIFYYSFLINLSYDATLPQGALVCLYDAANDIPFAMCGVDPSVNSYKILISKTGGSNVIGTTSLSYGKTYLIIIRYSFVAGGATNDPMYVWVNPDISAEPSTGSAEATLTNDNDGPTSFESFGMFTTDLTNKGSIKFDAIKVSYGSTSADAWSALSGAFSSNYTNYYPRTSATDLSNLNHWTDDINGNAGTSPTSFILPLQTFNINANITNPTIANSWTVSGGSNVNVTNTNGISINYSTIINIGTSSTVDMNHKPTIFKSNSSGTETASIAEIKGNLLNADNVTVERSIYENTPKRAWRFLSSPVSGTTINAAWQEGKNDNSNPNNGYGTHITGRAVNGVIGNGGFDAGITNASSIKTYNPAQNTWTPLTSTVTGDITDNQGYMLFVRGDRSLDITPANLPSPNNTMLRATGTLRQGAQSAISISSSQYAVVGNPYASTIDFEKFFTNNNNLISFYAWDPSLTGSNGVGGWNLVERNGGNYQVTPQGGSANAAASARYIPAGAAILVKSNSGNVNLVIDETFKTSNTTSLTYFRTNGTNTNLAVNLNNNAGETLDGIRVRYDAAYSNLINGEDATKVMNFGENISIVRNERSLIVEKRNVITANDTIFINLNNLKQATYQLKFFPTALNGVTAVLEDSYLNANTSISLNTGSTFSFTVDVNAASSGNRFRIVIRPSVSLPVTFTAISAEQNNAKAVTVKWSVSNEGDVDGYVVERSIDGRNFTAVANIPVNTFGGSVKNYQWLDVNAATGANYYRINSNGSYSSIVIVNIGNNPPGVSISPNPVKNGILSLQFNNLPKGNYEARVFNITGQLIVSKQIPYSGGCTIINVSLPATLSKGMYRLSIKNITTSFIIE